MSKSKTNLKEPWYYIPIACVFMAFLFIIAFPFYFCEHLGNLLKGLGWTGMNLN